MTERKPQLPPKEPGFIRYIMAANATGGGSIIAFLTSALIFFPLGYYTKYTQYKSQGAEIINQSVNNKSLDEKSSIKMNDDLMSLSQSLSYLGYSESDIKRLIGGKPTGLDALKNKFTTIIRGRTVYLPRDDCEDDYLGKQSSDRVNGVITTGYINRYKPNG